MMKIGSMISLLGALVLLGGCSGGGGGGSGEGDSINIEGLNCKVVFNGALTDPKSSPDYFVQQVEVVTSNTLILNRDTGPQLVELHAITPSRREDAAVALLRGLVASGVYFFPATETCQVTVGGGGLATSGHVITADGRSLTEQLIINNLSGEVEGSGSCAEELIAPCFAALKESSIPTSAGDIYDFLWKPAAESDYNKGLLIVHANPCDATVVVGGETLIAFPPGNGRCTTARSVTKSGCKFGSNVPVQIFDNATGAPYLFRDGTDTLIIPNGCDRYEYKTR